jgi:thiol-disulfide isomerase/thioredoxin
MRLLSFVLLTALLRLVFAEQQQQYFRSVLVADDSNFNSIVRNAKGRYTFVNFYSPACSHCNALGPQFTIVSELFKDNDKVQIVQIDAKDNVQTRMKEKILGFPTMRLYAFDGTHVASYKGERLADVMAGWITENTGAVPTYPEKIVQEIEGSETVRKFIFGGDGSRGKIIAFIAPWLEDWGQKVTQLERTSWGYSDQLNFYQVDATKEENSDIISELRITFYPTLFYLRPDGTLKVLEEKELNENKIKLFLDDETIGDSYEKLSEFTKQQEQEDVDEQAIGKGYGMHKNYDKYDNVDEDEIYKRMREL